MAQATMISTKALRAAILDGIGITALYEDGGTVELEFSSERSAKSFYDQLVNDSLLGFKHVPASATFTLAKDNLA
jgi:hypothetical protein